MRWYVSIGAVLVAGVLAGGDVAGIAAPGPGNQTGPRYADKEATVDVELAAACDLSGEHPTELRSDRRHRGGRHQRAAPAFR